jgi:MATE family multidrug resistance protein
MMFSTAIVYLPAWYLTQPWGNHGLWLAFALFSGARGVSLNWCYWRLTKSEAWLKVQI